MKPQVLCPLQLCTSWRDYLLGELARFSSALPWVTPFTKFYFSWIWVSLHRIHKIWLRYFLLNLNPSSESLLPGPTMSTFSSSSRPSSRVFCSLDPQPQPASPHIPIAWTSWQILSIRPAGFRVSSSLPPCPSFSTGALAHVYFPTVPMSVHHYHNRYSINICWINW